MSRPYEDEEDPTPRSVPPKKPTPKPTPPGVAKPVHNKVVAEPMVQPASPKQLPWGHAGSVNTPGELSDLTGRQGVIRLVGAGVHFDPPPFDRHVWQPALEQPGRYEMAWTEGDPADVRTLADLAAELRDPAAPKARLRLLDHVADTLLQMTGQLHDQGWRVGLLHAANVLIAPHSDGRELLLPDVGFTWRASRGAPPWKDVPGRPTWLNEDPSANRNVPLWDLDPVYQQFVSDNDAGVPVASRESDLKTIARLFAALFTGRPERELPGGMSGAPAWQVLNAVMRGEIASAEEFRTALQKTPLSTLWLHTDAPKKSRSPAIAMLLLLMAGGGVLAALLAAWQLGWLASAPTSSSGTFAAGPTSSTKSTTPPTGKAKPNAGSPNRPEKDVPWREKPTFPIPEGSELVALRKEYDGANDPRRRADILGRMYRANLLSDPRLREREWHWIEHLRGQYVAEWIDRYRAADVQVHKDITRRFDVAKSLHDMNIELDLLRQTSLPYTASLDEREKQCLEVSALRSSELGSPR